MVSFHFHIGMLMPLGGDEGTGIIPHSSLKVCLNSPLMVQQLWWKNSITSGFATRDRIFPSHLLNHGVGN